MLTIWLYTLTYKGLGGWERYVQYLLKFLPRYNVKVFLIDVEKPKFIVKDHNYLTVLKVPLRPNSRISIYTDLIYLYLNTLYKNTIDILHIPSQADAYMMRIIHAKHYVLTIHGLSMMVFKSIWNALKYKLLLKLINRADAVITVSEWTRELITEYLRVHPSCIHTVYNCVDRSIFNERKSVYDEYILAKLKINRPYFLHVSTGSIIKNPHLIIKAASLARLRERGVLLVFIGFSGSYSRLIKRIASYKGISDIVVTLNPIKNDRVLAALYRNAKAFILPSFIENCPFSLLEAMSCGCICIVSNRAALPEIGGDGVLYIERMDPALLAKRMIEVLRYEHEYLRKRAIQRVMKIFTPEVFIKRHIDVYKQVLGVF